MGRQRGGAPLETVSLVDPALGTGTFGSVHEIYQDNAKEVDKESF